MAHCWQSTTWWSIQTKENSSRVTRLAASSSGISPRTYVPTNWYVSSWCFVVPALTAGWLCRLQLATLQCALSASRRMAPASLREITRRVKPWIICGVTVGADVCGRANATCGRSMRSIQICPGSKPSPSSRRITNT